MKRIINYFIAFFKSLWQFIKQFFTSWKGIVSLIISFTLYVGWALAFIVIGFISSNAWYYSTGMAVVAFWAGPFTPMWGLIIATALVLQRYVFRDKNSMGWKEIKAYYKAENEKENKKAKEKKIKRLIAKYNKQKGKEYIVYGLE